MWMVLFLSQSLKGIVKMVLKKMGTWRINLGSGERELTVGNLVHYLLWRVNVGEHVHR